MFPFLIIALLGGAYLLYSKDASAAPDTTPAPASTASLDDPFLAHLRAVGDDLDILKRIEKTKAQIESTLLPIWNGPSAPMAGAAMEIRADAREAEVKGELGPASILRLRDISNDFATKYAAFRPDKKRRAPVRVQKDRRQ